MEEKEITAQVEGFVLVSAATIVLTGLLPVGSTLLASCFAHSSQNPVSLIRCSEPKLVRSLWFPFVDFELLHDLSILYREELVNWLIDYLGKSLMRFGELPKGESSSLWMDSSLYLQRL